MTLTHDFYQLTTLLNKSSHVHMYIYMHACTHVHIHAHMYTCIHTYTHVHMYTHTYTCTHIYTHTHTHTHTQQIFIMLLFTASVRSSKPQAGIVSSQVISYQHKPLNLVLIIVYSVL